MTKLVAYHNDPAIKAEYLARVGAHEKADEIRKGIYWDAGRGCAVGCTIHGNSHAKYETELGVPQMLARLEDCIFEGMPLADAKTFPRRFLEAIPVGADLSLVGWKFLSWLIETTLERHGNDKVRAGCADAVAVLRDRAVGKRVTKARAARARAGCILAADAAYSAAYATDAADAAYSAAYATDAADAAYSAASAHAAAHAAAAAYAAYAARYNEQAEKLLELLAAAPVPAPAAA